MDRRFLHKLFLLGLSLGANGPGWAQPAADPVRNDSTAATSLIKVVPPPDLLEHLVDAALQRFGVPNEDNTVTHFVVAALFLLGALLLRRVVTRIIFGQLKKLAGRGLSFAYPTQTVHVASLPGREG